MTSRQTAVPAREPARAGRGHLPRGQRPGRRRLARLLLTTLLIAGVLVGLRGGFALHGWHGPYHQDGVAIGVGLEIILAGLLVAVLVRGAGPATTSASTGCAACCGPRCWPAWPSSRRCCCWPSRCTPSAATAAAAHRAAADRPAELTRAPHPGRVFRLPFAGILYALLILALIGGIVACVVLLRRRQPEHDVRPPRSVGGRGAAE